jgi:hypothetical protein
MGAIQRQLLFLLFLNLGINAALPLRVNAESIPINPVPVEKPSSEPIMEDEEVEEVIEEDLDSEPIPVPVLPPGENKPTPPSPPPPKAEDNKEIEDDTVEEDAEIVKDNEEDEGLITPNPLLQEEEDKKPQQELQPLDPYDIEEQEFEADNALPKTPQNPFDKPNIDQLIQKQFNEDMWRLMRGALPCLETSATCLQLLQQRAIVQSPLLKELDARVQEANDKIEEAKASGRKIIKLSILTPALQYLLGPAPSPGQPQPAGTGLIDNLGAILRGKTGIINGLLRVVGIPLFQGSQGGNPEAQRSAIAVADLQIKVAQLQRSRAELSNKIREQTAISLIKFDEARTDFQTAQVLAGRVNDQFKVYEIRYTRGNSDTETYLTRLNQFDKTKAQTYRSWAKMRRSLFELKLLVLNVQEAEL